MHTQTCPCPCAQAAAEPLPEDDDSDAQICPNSSDDDDIPLTKRAAAKGAKENQVSACAKPESKKAVEAQLRGTHWALKRQPRRMRGDKEEDDDDDEEEEEVTDSYP